jgi:hypothetical protein
VPPPKKGKQTDAIFAHLKEVHEQAASEADTLRPSLDCKAPVAVGPFSRGGYRRTGARGCDHDFKPDAVLTPLGLFRPQTPESALFFTDSKATSDFMADCLGRWIEERAEALKGVRKLVLDLDNGPRNSGQRSQRLLRMALLAQQYRWAVVLVYHPPYHSKYDPVERLWGLLENYWRGELLDSEAAVLGYAAGMTYNGVHPRVRRCTGQYPRGVKLTRAQRRRLEQWLQRKPGLEKWAIEIAPPPPDQTIT